MEQKTHIDDPFIITVGHDEIVIRRRYEFASIANDFLIALWFLVGSILFLYPSMEKAGIWCFILGSVEFLIRPAIRLASHIHLQRIPANRWES